jgi:uncharacterized protein (DUF1697 family)
VATHAAFLRAVNLGPTRKAGSAELRDAFEGMGFEDVATFRNSGNVVFSGRGHERALAETIELGLERALGFEVPAFVRDAAALEAISAREPFPAKAVEAAKGKPQVALLRSKPDARLRKQVLALATEDDLLEMVGSELYWLPRAGVRDSSLGMKGIERAIGPGGATIRTHGTISQLNAKFFQAA